MTLIDDLRAYTSPSDDYLSVLLNAAADEIEGMAAEIVRLGQVIETYDSVLQDR